MTVDVVAISTAPGSKAEDPVPVEDARSALRDDDRAKRRIDLATERVGDLKERVSSPSVRRIPDDGHAECRTQPLEAIGEAVGVGVAKVVTEHEDGNVRAGEPVSIWSSVQRASPDTVSSDGESLNRTICT